MRLAIKHLNIHLINEPSEIKKYWKNETSNQILVLLLEANAYVFDSTPSPKKRSAPLFSSPGCYSARGAATPSSAEPVVYEANSPSQPKDTVITPLREGYVNRAARPRKVASMIEVNLHNEEDIRRNLAYDSDKSSPGKPSPHKPEKTADDLAAELAQWQEWYEGSGNRHDKGVEGDREPEMDGVERHQDQSDDDSIIWDPSILDRSTLSTLKATSLQILSTRSSVTAAKDSSKPSSDIPSADSPACKTTKVTFLLLARLSLRSRAKAKPGASCTWMK